MKRYYSFFIRTYGDLQNVRNILLDNGADHYCGIVHDKDFNADGSVKASHLHFLVCFQYNKSLSAVQKILRLNIVDGLVQNSDVSPLGEGEFSDTFRYLTHDGYKNKHLYDKSELVSDDLEYFEKRSASECSNPSDDKEVFVQMFLDFGSFLGGKIRFLDIVKKYGRDFVYHTSHLRAAYDSMTDEEFTELTGLKPAVVQYHDRLLDLYEERLKKECEEKKIRNSTILGQGGVLVDNSTYQSINPTSGEVKIYKKM